MSSLLPPVTSRGPAPDPGAPLLEVITQPLYSAMAIANALFPAELRAFNYQLGDTVVGAGDAAVGASYYHTNMEVAGALATPKVFEVTGIRFIFSNLDHNTGGNPALGQTHPAIPAAGTDAVLHDDMLRLFWGIHFSLHVGTKDYMSAPLWAIPGNCGLSGYAALAHDDGAAPEQHLITAVQGAGKYCSLQPYTVFIPSQQSFHTKLRGPQVTPPTLVGNDSLAWIMLDGRLGREAQ